MIEFLMREQLPMIYIAQGAVLISDGRRRWEPEHFRDRLSFLTTFCEQWPERQPERQSSDRPG